MGDPLHSADHFDAAFDAAAARLRAAVADACATPGPWPARVCAAIDAALRFTAEDPAAARLLLLEPWARGEDALARREDLLDRLAAPLASGRRQLASSSELPAIAERFLLASLASTFAALLATGGELPPARRAVLAAELSEYILLPYLGPARARAWARLPRAQLLPVRG